MMHEEKTLLRDCEALMIPSGNPLTLEKDLTVVITQALGGSFTVATPHGLARIQEQDADALGMEASPNTEQAPRAAGDAVDEDEVWQQLRYVYDPEIPVNIVDLGLVYDCQLIKQDDGSQKVEVKMTLTAPGCGMGPAIAEDARMRVLQLDGVDEAEVLLVWDPPWHQDMMSEEGKMKLGLI
ncbi:MAG: putative Fe-S cluster assembly protein SufT [Verrucomicrobiales bacterium]